MFNKNIFRVALVIFLFNSLFVDQISVEAQACRYLGTCDEADEYLPDLPSISIEDISREFDNCLNRGGCDPSDIAETFSDEVDSCFSGGCDPSNFIADFTMSGIGYLGSILYSEAAETMRIRHSRRTSRTLTDYQKEYLRPIFGDLVDEARVIYNAITMDNYGTFEYRGTWYTLNQPSAAQVYGNTIYVTDDFLGDNYEQVILLAHEMVHVRQTQRYGGIVGFGYNYFVGWAEGGFSYSNNPLEIEGDEMERNYYLFVNNAAETQFNQLNLYEGNEYYGTASAGGWIPIATSQSQNSIYYEFNNIFNDFEDSNGDCIGYVQRNPVAIIEVTEPIDYIRIAFESEIDTTMFIFYVNDGQLHYTCADDYTDEDGVFSLSPQIAYTDIPTPSTLYVWLGTYSGILEYAEGTLTVSSQRPSQISQPILSSAPSITNISVAPSGSNEQTLISTLLFSDPDGDAVRLEYDIVESSSSNITVRGGVINTPRAQQISGSTLTGTWGCSGTGYVTLSAYIVDAQGNTSNTYEFTYDCSVFSQSGSNSSTSSSNTQSTTSDTDCPGVLPSILSLDITARVATSDESSLTVRSTPSVNGQFVRWAPYDISLDVLQGPECVDGYRWWFVVLPSTYRGWIADGDGDDYWIVPEN